MKRILTFQLLLLFVVQIRAQLPPDFYDQVVTESFDFPIGLTWDHDRTMYVWEKGGKVWQVDTNGVRYPQPLIDISEEVADWRDHGLLGFALDPDYADNGYFYLLYAADRHYLLHYGTPEYHPDTTNAFQPSIGRVTRYTADPNTNFTSLISDSRKVLIGASFDDGFPLIHESHSVGTLVFGTDKTLLVSAGDGNSNRGADKGGEDFGSYVNQAIADGFLQPHEDIGIYRSQSLRTLSGKILRIDPNTGAGLPSNPFYDAANPSSARSRIWARGFRNPYRVTMRPNTGSHYPDAGDPGVLFVGDVGGGKWEELNIVTTGGQNFGWPITEGHEWYPDIVNGSSPFDSTAVNPLAGGGCPEYFSYLDLFGRPDDPQPANPCNEAQTIPASVFPSTETFAQLAWANSRWNKPVRATVARIDANNQIEVAELGTPESWLDGPGFGGFASMAGTFYQNGNFPDFYENKYFHLDYDDWIRVLEFDNDHQLVRVDTFHQDAYQIFFIAQHPTDGCLYFTNLRGQIRKICYGGNPLPIVEIEADTTYGPGELTVQFDGTGSYAPFGSPLSYHWNFGDGDVSNLPAPQHTFETDSGEPTTFLVQLTVTDTTNTFASAKQIISLNNTPPRVEITSFRDGDRYPLDYTHPLRLAASVVDAEHSDAVLRYQWQAILHHNTHFHQENPDTNRTSYAIISPNGCDGEDYWYRVRLRVTDPEGLFTEVEQNIYPNCNGFGDTPELSTRIEGSEIRLEWTRPAGTEWQDFELQRGVDQTRFDVLASGNAEWQNHVDAAPVRGLNYYRLKYRDPFGNYGFTGVHAVQFPPRPDVYVYPNPVGDAMQLVVKRPAGNSVRLEIFDVRGVRLSEVEWSSNSGTYFEETVLTDRLERGVYIYRVSTGDAVVVGELVK